MRLRRLPLWLTALTYGSLFRDCRRKHSGVLRLGWQQRLSTVLTSCLQANNMPAHSGGNAKGRTDISRVAAYFDRPINEAAQILGALLKRCTWSLRMADACLTDICPTVLKKICRRHGLKRWPNRRIRSINKQIALLKAVIQDGCSEGACKIARLWGTRFNH